MSTQEREQLPPPAAQRDEWLSFYEKVFPAAHAADGVVESANALLLPERPPGFDRLILVIPGVTLAMAIAASQREFSCWSHGMDSIGKMKDDARTPERGPYAAFVRGRGAADQEWDGVPAAAIWERKVAGVTLLERLLLGLKRFRETGEHLDRTPGAHTLCTGSVTKDGLVPYAWCQDAPHGPFVGVGVRNPRVGGPGQRMREVRC